ncbi:MAG TPA: cyclic nucleotide-binding domain-containing protein [Chloroflexi bacterium]|nr:cyclic nucleotide-binding domain-containing protein [Chloroflexota bacterium]
MYKDKPKFGPEQFTAGTDIIQQGDTPDKFYIILSGEVEVVDQPPGQLERALNVLGPGDYFGEVGLSLGSRRMATVRAITNVSVMAMDYQTFRHWIDSSPLVADEINTLVAQRMPPDDALELIEEALPWELTEEEGRTAVKTAEQYAPHEAIICQGDEADKFYIIIEGFVTVSHTGDDGREYILAHLTSGDYFGEIGLLDGSSRIATVRALTPVKVVSFDRDTFRRWMAESPASHEEIRQTANRRSRDTGMLSLPDEQI